MRFLTIVLSCVLISAQLFADDGEGTEFSAPDGFFAHEARRNEDRTRNYFAFPAISYVVPGFAQYVYGQIGAGLTYSAIGAVGLGVGIHGIAALGENPTIDDIDSKDWRIRQAAWGLKTYDLAGSLSAYHAFRTSVAGHHRERFDFLGEGETTDELISAPFRLHYFTRLTSLIPLGLLTGGLIAIMANDDYHTVPVYGGDLAYSVGLSYNAGVGEEALFRGFMMPIMVDIVDSPLLGNLATASLFAVAHVSSGNPIPWPQFVLGYYFGWLVQHNNWTLSEAIFVHTWWDIIVFSFNFAQGDKKAALYVPLYQTQF